MLEISVYQTTGRHFPEGSHFHSRRCDKLTSLIIPFNVFRSRNKTTYDYPKVPITLTVTLRFLNE